LSITFFNNGINEGVELNEVVNLALDTLKGCGVAVEVGCFTEEFSSETVVGADEDSVLVAV
jgi:hypothetical protein